MTETVRKPRKFRRAFVQRAECVVGDDGDKVVDFSADLFDGRESAKDLRSLSGWLLKVAAWLEDTTNGD